MRFSRKLHWAGARRLRRFSAFTASPDRPLVKVIGIFRSGTNLTRSVLETHYRVRVSYSKWGWKHGLPHTDVTAGHQLSFPVPTLLISRDPVEASLSLYRFWQKTRPELDTGRDFSDFIRRPFIVYDNSSPDTPRYLYRTPVDYWNQFHYAYLNWPALQPRLHLIRYMDLVADPHGIITGIARDAGLKRRTTGTITLPDREILPSADHQGSSDGGQFAKRSIAISPEDQAYIWEMTDPGVAEGLGYHPSAEERIDHVG